ncbi:hypothetical protein HanIR_Chr11g0549651 [Helianthus annuus]|nr:hypothetical protein HanIR_Chr11g0549651 [Helianthus annuus]
MERHFVSNSKTTPELGADITTGLHSFRLNVSSFRNLFSLQSLLVRHLKESPYATIVND